MTFKIDFINGKTITWQKTTAGTQAKTQNQYEPRFYLEAGHKQLQSARPWLTSQEETTATTFEEWKPTLSKNHKKVLRIDTKTNQKLKTLVNKTKKKFGRTHFKFYNVSLSPQFRYCIQQETCPTPKTQLQEMELEIHRKHLADQKLKKLKVDGEELGKNPAEKFQEIWKTKNPDLILINHSKILNLLRRKTPKNFKLGRIKEFQKLAKGNTVTSYGRTQYSAQRYNIPGRIIIDKSNSFLLKDATLEGMWNLVKRSYRPMQELAWGSIGRLLTSIEIKKAYLEKRTLTPWKNWRPEKFKKASTLHKADRGGFIFTPDPNIHKDVYEADFASLFPNIMIKKNISPETVCCNCCNNKKVPELDYSICENKQGFIPQVLKPLVTDRQKMKDKLNQKKLEAEKRRHLQGSSDAIKWLLVSCFGYMGHEHASYGSIECHQAIQAFDREIMVKTKEKFEKNGYKIVHGIIDSIWVQKKSPQAKKFSQVCKEISKDIGIKLEPEHKFEWCAFVPRSSSSSNIATLNRYFGKKESGEFKTAGIQTEQRTTSEYTKKSQIKMIKEFDKSRNPHQVLETLQKQIKKLENMNVDPSQLLRTRKISKTLETYKAKNRGYSALKRARKHDLEIKPGQSLKYVVYKDKAQSIERVRLDFEKPEKYDVNFYRTQLIRAAESILSPLNKDREDIKKALKNNNTTAITDYL